jgi:hypothetical protein
VYHRGAPLSIRVLRPSQDSSWHSMSKSPQLRRPQVVPWQQLCVGSHIMCSVACTTMTMLLHYVVTHLNLLLMSFALLSASLLLPSIKSPSSSSVQHSDLRHLVIYSDSTSAIARANHSGRPRPSASSSPPWSRKGGQGKSSGSMDTPESQVTSALTC